MTDHRTDRNPAAPDSGGAREMAEALAEHRYQYDRRLCACGVECGVFCDNLTHPEHQADALLASPQFARLVAEAKAEAWDEGWRAHTDYLAAVTVWNASEGAETPDALHARNPHRAALTAEAAQ